MFLTASLQRVLYRWPQGIRRCPPSRVYICPYTCSFVTFTSRRLQQREKPARRKGHPSLRFFHDFAAALIPNFHSFVIFTRPSFLTRSYNKCSSVVFTCGRLQQGEKPGRRHGHLCLRFVHDFVSAVFKTQNSCGWRCLSMERTAMRHLRGQNLRCSNPLKYVFICLVLHLENPVLAILAVFHVFTP